MGQSSALTRRPAYRVAYIILSGLLAAIVAALFLRDSGINRNPAAAFGDMVYGTANRPFVYRTLLPTAVRGITVLTPRPIRSAVAHNPEIRSLLQALNWGQRVNLDRFGYESVIALAFMYLALLGFVFAFRSLIGALVSAPAAFVDLVPLVALSGLVLFFDFGYLYDFSTLFLFTCCFALMARRRWPDYLVVFFLACVNKETAILLPVVFAAVFLRDADLDVGAFARLLVTQIGIYLLIRAVLLITFAGNGGSVTEFHLYDYNLRQVAAYNPRLILTIAVLVGICGLVVLRWRQVPPLVRAGPLVLAPLVGLATFFGLIDEWRQYYEAYPLVVLLIAQTAASVAGLPVMPGRPHTGRLPRPVPAEAVERTCEA